MHVPFIFSKAGVVETTPTIPANTPLANVNFLQFIDTVVK